MSQTKEKTITLPNPVHYTGKFVEAISFAAPIVVGFTVAGMTGNFISDSFQDEIDNVGSSEQQELVAEHQVDLQDLKKQKLQLDIAQAEHAYQKEFGDAASSTVKLQSLQNAFTEQAQQELMDLYLQGATSEGAGIGEQDFQDLHKTFLSIAQEDVDLKAMGYRTNISVGILDEALANTNLPENSSDIERYNAMKQINDIMNDETNDGLGFAVLGWVASFFVSLVLSTGAFMTAGDKMSKQSSTVTLGRRRTRHQPKNMKH